MRRKQVTTIALFTILIMLLPLLAGCGSEVSDLPAGSTAETEAPENTTEAPELTSEEPTTEAPTTENPTTEEPAELPTEGPKVLIPEFDPVIGVTEVIAAGYDEAWPFCEGYAVVGIKQGEATKYNYIDTEGQLLLDEWVDIALSFSEGLACVGYDAGITVEKYGLPLYRFGYVDTNGEMAIPAEILCYEGHYPRAFHDGYAEIFYVDPDGEEMKIDYQGIVVRSNVIDREGKRLFDVELTYLSTMYSYGYYRSRERVLPIEGEWNELDYCMHNEWVRNRLNGGDGSSYVSSQLEGITWLVDEEGKIEQTLAGELYELGENYYVLYPEDGGNRSLYDREFNLISNGEYQSIQEGIDGQIIVSVNVINEYGAERSKNQVLDSALTPVSGLYDDIRATKVGYIGTNFNSQYKYELFGTDGQVFRQIAEELTTFQYFSDGYYDSEGFRWAEDGFFIGSAWESGNFDRQIKYYYSSTGELFHTGKDAVCRQVSENLFVIGIKGGKGRLIDKAFKTLLELPKADVINYAGDEENIYLCCYEGEVVYWYHLSKEDGTWKISEQGTEQKATFNRTIEGWRFVTDENEISQVISETEYDGPAVLEWKDGRVLDESKAVSLVSEGLYLVAENQEYVETYGYDAWNYCLKFDGEAVSEVYEELDVVSEDHIAFCKDGKWGYLKVERGE